MVSFSVLFESCKPLQRVTASAYAKNKQNRLPLLHFALDRRRAKHARGFTSLQSAQHWRCKLRKWTRGEQLPKIKQSFGITFGSQKLFKIQS
jgi:hypothetical protein